MPTSLTPQDASSQRLRVAIGCLQLQTPTSPRTGLVLRPERGYRLMAFAFRDSVDAMIGWGMGKWGVVASVRRV
jgi:hypothetical protein